MNRQDFSKNTNREILKLLLTYNSRTVPLLDVNHKDGFDRTPLHFAVSLKNEFAIKSLLDAGADLYSKDVDGSQPLTSVPATVLENYFDDSITLYTDRGAFGILQGVEFDYSIFKQVDQNSSKTANEMEFFHQIQKKPELRTLLNHPLSESFLYSKWCLIKNYYYLNFTFYFLFCVALNAYIFQIHDCPSPSTSYNSSQSTDTGINHHSSSILCNASGLGIGIITFLFYIMFILRELFQVLLSKKTYVRSAENWLEMMIILGVGVLFAIERNAHLAATVILMSCVELVFLLGKHPWFSVYIEMFKTVALNFAKFFALFSILTISFANSFYIIFRDTTEEYTSSENEINVNPPNHTIENSINLWPDLWVSLIKSIIMMTGELDASNIPLGKNFNYTYVFFSLFVFLVPMVLYNLLNGLAVSDTTAIMKDSEIVAVMSRVELMWHLESLLNSKSLQFFSKHCPEFLNHRFFWDVEHKQLIVSSDSKYSIGNDISDKIIGYMPLTIIKQAKVIVEKRNHSNSSKDMDQNSSADAAKKTSTNSECINETVHKISDQIHKLKLGIDRKISEMNLRIAEINVRNDEANAKITDRVEKLLQSVERNDIKLEIDEKNTEMKRRIDEMDAKITDRFEKLLQSVERNNKLLESVAQADHLKQKEQVGDEDELLK
ncbi:transient receptor potential cation channel protein painless-like [Planococcus citri]|uniref:transient receptor potential cation channel protein painless-like n=1 Tax=Planococcus citri TaxID=170843 RepID=UPI0031F94323